MRSSARLRTGSRRNNADAHCPRRNFPINNAFTRACRAVHRRWEQQFFRGAHGPSTMRRLSTSDSRSPVALPATPVPSASEQQQNDDDDQKHFHLTRLRSRPCIATLPLDGAPSWIWLVGYRSSTRGVANCSKIDMRRCRHDPRCRRRGVPNRTAEAVGG